MSLVKEYAVSNGVYSITEGPFLQNIFWLDLQAFESIPEQLEALIAATEDGL